MKHSALALLVASSLLAACVAHAATRPRYGGTLRVTMAAAPSSLDPAVLEASTSLSREQFVVLDFRYAGDVGRARENATGAGDLLAAGAR